MSKFRDNVYDVTMNYIAPLSMLILMVGLTANLVFILYTMIDQYMYTDNETAITGSESAIIETTSESEEIRIIQQDDYVIVVKGEQEIVVEDVENLQYVLAAILG